MENFMTYELLYSTTRASWNEESVGKRRSILRSLGKEEVFAECLFEQLPAAERELLLNRQEKIA